MSNSKKNESWLPPLWILALITIWLSFWLLHELKEIVVLLVVGYCIAYVISPALDYLQKFKVSRTMGFFILSALFLLFVEILIVTALPSLAREYAHLSENLPAYFETAKLKISELLTRYHEYLPATLKTQDPAAIINNLLPHIKPEMLTGIFAGALGALLQGYSITLTVLNLTLLPFIVFYLAIDFKQLHDEISLLFPLKQRKKVLKVASEINLYISSFVRGQFVVCCLLFLMYAVGLWILGVELWLILAVISGFGNVVPFAGFLIGIVLSSIIALVSSGDFSLLLKVWALFAFVQFLEGTFITPKVVGESVGLSPLMVILAIVAGGKLFGLLGIFLAVPAAAGFKVLFRYLHVWVINRSTA